MVFDRRGAMRFSAKTFREVECPEPVVGHYFVYVLQCSDMSLYIGCTHNLASRLKHQNERRASSWTAGRLPIRLVYYEILPGLLSARRRERQLKKWERAKKDALIEGELGVLSRVSGAKKQQEAWKHARSAELLGSLRHGDPTWNASSTPTSIQLRLLSPVVLNEFADALVDLRHINIFGQHMP